MRCLLIDPELDYFVIHNALNYERPVQVICSAGDLHALEAFGADSLVEDKLLIQNIFEGRH